MHSTKLRLVGLVAASSLALTACGGGDTKDESGPGASASASATSDSTPGADPSASADAGSSASASAQPSGTPTAASTATPDPKAAGKLADITVSDVDGKKGPQLKFAKTPFTVKELQRKTLTKGDGEEITKKHIVTVDYAVYNGSTGKQLQSSYGTPEGKAGMDMTAETTLPGVVKGLVGTKVGDTTLIAIPAKEAFGDQGQPSIGIGAGDSLVFVITSEKVTTVLEHAEGEEVKPKEGLPTVTWSETAPAKITMPDKAAPKELVVQDLITGKGAEVKSGQSITVHYTGVTWKNGAEGPVFDSSYKTGKPATFPIGVGQVIKGWDTGLVGKKVGSRVLLVVPPAQGYGKEGREPSIKGTDTLVFVVDILAAS